MGQETHRLGGMSARSTRADRVREALADDIISGRFEAGVKLDEASLAKRFDVSRTPVREALRELAATGLVCSKPHQGAIVAPLPDQRVAEIFEAVAELEGVCARLCALNMTAADRRNFEALHHRCREMVQLGDAERYHYANADFHEAIRRGSHNVVLEEVVGTMRNRFAPLSRAQFRGAGRLAQSNTEHDEIVRAILRGDANEAYRVTVNHMSNVRRAFVEYTSSLQTATNETTTNEAAASEAAE